MVLANLEQVVREKKMVERIDWYKKSKEGVK